MYNSYLYFDRVDMPITFRQLAQKYKATSCFEYTQDDFIHLFDRLFPGKSRDAGFCDGLSRHWFFYRAQNISLIQHLNALTTTTELTGEQCSLIRNIDSIQTTHLRKDGDGPVFTHPFTDKNGYRGKWLDKDEEWYGNKKIKHYKLSESGNHLDPLMQSLRLHPGHLSHLVFKSSKMKGSHAVSLTCQIKPDKIEYVLFDPNYGEVTFHSMKQFRKFLNEFFPRFYGLNLTNKNEEFAITVYQPALFETSKDLTLLGHVEHWMKTKRRDLINEWIASSDRFPSLEHQPKRQTTVRKDKPLETSVENIVQLTTPFVLDIAHNILSSIVLSGRYEDLLSNSVDKLKDSTKTTVLLSMPGKFFLKKLLTPEMLHETIGNLKEAINKEFIQEFLILFKSEFKKQHDLVFPEKIRLSDPEIANWMLKNFISDIMEYFSLCNDATALQTFLKDSAHQNKIKVIRLTLLNVLLEKKKTEQLFSFLKKIMPPALITTSVRTYLGLISDKTFSEFLQELLTEFINAVFNPDVILHSKKSTTENPKPHGSKQPHDAKTCIPTNPDPKELKKTVITTILTLKPLVASATKAAVTKQRLPVLRKYCFNMVSKSQGNGLINQCIKLVLYFTGSKSNIDEFINNIENGLTESVLNQQFAKLPHEKVVQFFHLAEQFFGNTLSNSFQAHYEGSMLRKISAKNLISEMLDMFRKIKPKDWSPILDVIFTNHPVKKWFAKIFVKYLSDSSILKNIIENAASKLNNIIDPQLEPFLQTFKTFKKQLAATTQSTHTARKELLRKFDILTKHTVMAKVEIDKHISQINQEIEKNEELLDGIVLTPSLGPKAKQEDLNRAKQYKNDIKMLNETRNELMKTQEFIKELCDPNEAKLMRNILSQGDKAELQQLLKRLQNIEDSLDSLVYSMKKSETHKSEFEDANKLRDLVAKAKHGIKNRFLFSEVEAHQNRLKCSSLLDKIDLAFEHRKKIQIDTHRIHNSCITLFSETERIKKQNYKNKQISKLATEVHKLIRPVIGK